MQTSLFAELAYEYLPTSNAAILQIDASMVNL